jgi:hypothetical protein
MMKVLCPKKEVSLVVILVESIGARSTRAQISVLAEI